jgi:hypothetical protein
MLKQFTIDESYITDVNVRTVTSTLDNPDDPTPEDLIKILQGQHQWISLSHKDHDEFTKLRNQLEELGYIETQRSWWNGDRVLKSFKLNEWTFRKGHKFPCAGAMHTSITCARKYKWKSISEL